MIKNDFGHPAFIMRFNKEELFIGVRSLKSHIHRINLLSVNEHFGARTTTKESFWSSSVILHQALQHSSGFNSNFAQQMTKNEKKKMKYILQFIIIMAISLIGELLNRVIPLPIPASIYGMAILFTTLCTGIIKLSAVKETGKFLIYIMPILFIPSAVGLLDSWAVMQNFLPAIIVIVIMSTIFVTGAAGRMTQFIINRNKKEKR